MTKSVGKVKLDTLTGKLRAVPNNGGLKKSLLSTYKEDVERLEREVSQWKAMYGLVSDELEDAQVKLNRQAKKIAFMEKPGFFSRVASFVRNVGAWALD